MVDRWNSLKANIPIGTAPTGLELPRLALPEIDEAGEITRYLLGEGLPGEFPFTGGAYREMYLEPLREPEAGSYGNVGKNGKNGHAKNGKNGAKTAVKAKAVEVEEPTRLFSGLGLAEDTNERFHFLTGHQRSARLSTAFDGPTLYGIDSDAEGVFGKIGEGGLAIDTYEDMIRLYDGFDMGSPSFSASMTISGPGAHHHGDVHRSGEKTFWSQGGAKSSRHYSGRYFQGSAGTERNHLPNGSVPSFPLRHD